MGGAITHKTGASLTTQTQYPYCILSLKLWFRHKSGRVYHCIEYYFQKHKQVIRETCQCGFDIKNDVPVYQVLINARKIGACVSLPMYYIHLFCTLRSLVFHKGYWGKLCTYVYWRAGASQPSRSTGTIWRTGAAIPNKRNDVHVILQC